MTVKCALPGGYTPQPRWATHRGCMPGAQGWSPAREAKASSQFKSMTSSTRPRQLCRHDMPRLVLSQSVQATFSATQYRLLQRTPSTLRAPQEWLLHPSSQQNASRATPVADRVAVLPFWSTSPPLLGYTGPVTRGGRRQRAQLSTTPADYTTQPAAQLTLAAPHRPMAGSTTPPQHHHNHTLKAPRPLRWWPSQTAAPRSR